ncbi:MAG: VanZ family protein [Flavobacterium sp.]
MALSKYFWPAATWTVIITVACMVSMDTFGEANSVFSLPNKDKLLHGIFYFGFTVLWALFFRTRPNVKNPIFLGFTFAVVYGIIIEICQAFFTTNRSGDIIDALANSAGAAIAVLVLKLFLNKNK